MSEAYRSQDTYRQRAFCAEVASHAPMLQSNAVGTDETGGLYRCTARPCLSRADCLDCLVSHIWHAKPAPASGHTLPSG